MKKIEQLKRELQAKRQELESAIEAKAENVAELKETVESIIRSINEQKTLDDAELALRNENPKEGEEVKRFSFQSFLREAMTGNLTGLNAEMHQEAQKEAREFNRSISNFGIPSIALRAIAGQNVTTPADGGNLVGKDAVRYYAALRNRLALTQAGATFLTGLTGNVPVVSGGAFTGQWLAEGADANVEKMSFGGSVMTPKRLAIIGALTRQLLYQSSPDVEALIINAITAAHAQAIEVAAINGAGGTQPTGILNTTGIGSVAIGENGGEITRKAVVDLETAIAGYDVDLNILKYVTNSKVVGALKTTPIASGSDKVLMESNILNGYDVLRTNNVPANLTKGTGNGLSAMIFGDFSKLLIGTWGGLDILVDPYVLGASGQIRFIMDTYHDVAVAQPAAFAAIKDINA